MTRETTLTEERPGQLGVASPEPGHALMDTMEAVEQGVKEGMHQAQDAVEATGRAARAAGSALAWALDVPGHVARHPWLLVGAAVLVGLLVLRLRRRD